MSAYTVIATLALVSVLAMAITKLFTTRIGYEMRYGKSVYSMDQIRNAMFSIRVVIACVTVIINCLFLLWVTYVPPH